MKKESILVHEMSNVDALQQDQLDELLDSCGSGYGSGSEETPLYVKAGSGIYSIEGAPYNIGISWEAGPATGLYRTAISHKVNYSNKLEMTNDSLNFTWGSGYTIHFSGTLEFKYWISPQKYKLAYHQFNDAVFPVPEQYWT